MSQAPPPIVARLTASGQAGIAMVGVKGPDACTLVARCFAPLAARQPHPPDRVLFGTFTDHGEPIDEVMVAVQPVGSWHTVEVCCHGGAAAVDGVVGALERCGARVVNWQTYGASHPPDHPARALATSAMLQLPWALTERAAGVLLDQARGALDREVDEIVRLVEHGDRDVATLAVDRLMATAPVGLHLTHAWRVTLVGRANVGKSTLMNALLGYPRVTVSPVPGTTRDVVRQVAAVDGWPIELADTAGLRPVRQGIEQASIERTHRRLRQSELALVVLDRSEPLTPDDGRLLGVEFPCPVVPVANKSDLPPAWPTDPVPGALPVSALHGDGLDDLVDRLAAALVPCPPEPGAPVVFDARQMPILDRVRRALGAGAAHDATRLLRELALLPAEAAPDVGGI